MSQPSPTSPLQLRRGREVSLHEAKSSEVGSAPFLDSAVEVDAADVADNCDKDCAVDNFALQADNPSFDATPLDHKYIQRTLTQLPSMSVKVSGFLRGQSVATLRTFAAATTANA
jgi:hypothetical protein